MTSRTGPVARNAVAAIGAAAILAALPSAAGADWTGAQTVPGSTNALERAIAVNGRGDVAIVSTHGDGSSAAGAARITVRAATRRAGTEAFRTRTLRGASLRSASDVAVAVDPRGETTVAWVERTASGRTVRAAHRTVAGRWSRVQDLARTSYLSNVDLRLAAAPDGTVLLTHNARATGARRVTAVWRSRGRSFGTPQALRSDRALTQASLAFAPSGRAYLVGLRGCIPVVFDATARGRRFGAARRITDDPVMTLRLAVIGRDSAVVAWLAGGCGSTEPSGGVPRAAGIVSGRVSVPAGLGDPHGLDLQLAGAATGAEATWTNVQSPPQRLLRTARVSSLGSVGPAATRSDGGVALLADHRGDQLVAQTDREYLPLGMTLVARPADGAALEPAPLGVDGFSWEGSLAGAPDGRALAIVQTRGSALAATVWRPGD